MVDVHPSSLGISEPHNEVKGCQCIGGSLLSWVHSVTDYVSQYTTTSLHILYTTLLLHAYIRNSKTFPIVKTLESILLLPTYVYIRKSLYNHFHYSMYIRIMYFIHLRTYIVSMYSSDLTIDT